MNSTTRLPHCKYYFSCPSSSIPTLLTCPKTSSIFYPITSSIFFPITSSILLTVLDQEPSKKNQIKPTFRQVWSGLVRTNLNKLNNLKKLTKTQQPQPPFFFSSFKRHFLQLRHQTFYQIFPPYNYKNFFYNDQHFSLFNKQP